ncbi:MAG: methylated-DNA--[protein]-cysteine S-methyltransferase [Vulcanimicrobiaceae bacterium]
MPASRPAAGPSARGRRIAYCVFDTSLGWRGIAWTECGDSGVPSAVVRFQLPEATSKATGTETYGELARAIGQPTAARAVGLALGRNPIALIIPCHRVLAAGGKPGRFSAHGGNVTKAKMLALEGVTFEPRPLITSAKDIRQAAMMLKARDSRLVHCMAKPIEFQLKTEQSPRPDAKTSRCA